MSKAANDNDRAPVTAAADEGGVRRFERRLAHPPEKVWRALTETSELAKWFPAIVEGEPAVGGELRFEERGADGVVRTGVVTECDPPRVLTYTWGDDTLRWELSPAPGGCLLVFTTTSGAAVKPADARASAIAHAAFRRAA